MSATLEAADSDDEGCTLAIGDLEVILNALDGEIAILSHVAASANEIKSDEICLIREHLAVIHQKLTAAWTAVWDEQVAEQAKTAAATKAAETMRRGCAVPGSAADIRQAESLWRMLGMAGQVSPNCAPRDGRVFGRQQRGRSDEPASLSPGVVR
jgi:hypothetical protein